jgi:peptidoglycan/LPS O-acetylase OafA/YrhL
LREFDAIRGITAMVIVIAHLGLIKDTRWVLASVDLFFVLSGYFITVNVMKGERTLGFFGRFFARRALRIWPAYYAGLVACLITNAYLTWDHPPDAWPYYVTFTQNVQAYWGAPLPKFSGMFLHTWTLAIEEQFYVLWPILVLGLGRRWVVPLAVAFVAIPFGLRANGVLPFLLLTRCDGLAVGALLAVLFGERDLPRRHANAERIAFSSLGVALLAAPTIGALVCSLGAGSSSRWPDWVGAMGTTQCCLVFGCLAGLVLSLEGHPALGVLRVRWLCYIGQISYGLYLYHPLVFASMPRLYERYVMRRLGITSSLLMNVILVAYCFILAELSRRLVEGPFIALKARIGTDRARWPVTVRADSANAPAGPHAGVRAGELAQR